MFAEGAVGESVCGALAADPFIDARSMESVPAVVDLPQRLTLLELIEANAARVNGCAATTWNRVSNLSCELSDDRIEPSLS